MQMYLLRAYCNDSRGKEVDINIDGNDTNIITNRVSYNKVVETAKASQILSTIENAVNGTTYDEQYLPMKFSNSQRFDPVIPVKSIKISVSNTSVDTTIQFYAFAIYYDDIVEPEEEIMTSVDEIQLESQSQKEYYDLMGRKLPSEPQNGLYILKTSSKVEKRIANNK